MTATLPDGFTLDQPPAQTGTEPVPATTVFPPTLPPGYTVDPQHPAAGPSGSVATDWERRLATAGIDAVAGLGSTPRLITQGIDWLGNKVGIDIGADPALASLRRSDGQQSFPDFQTLRERGFQRTGATEYVPETTAGRLTQAGLTAGTGAVLSGPRAIIPSIVGGATGELGAEIWPEHPMAGRVLGFLFGAHTASTVGNAVARTTANAAGIGGPTTQVGQAFERQAITPTTSAADATQSWQTAAEKAAAKLGPGATPQDTGAALQSAVSDWKTKTWQPTADSKWTAFRQQVPSNTPIQVNGYQKALQDVNQDFGGASETAKALQPGLGRTLQDALTLDISPKGELSWQAVQATRSRLGQLMQSSDPDIARTAKRLYAGLSSDMEAGANATSPGAATAFKDASDYTWAGHQLLDNHLNPILRANTPEQAAQYAMQQVRLGGTRLSAVDIAAPGQPQNLGAAFLRQASEAGPDVLGKRLAALSPQARNQLFGGPGSGVPQDLEDLVAIAQKQREIQQTAAPPKFSSDAGRFVTAMEAGKVGQELGGTPGRIAGIGLGYVAAPALPYIERQIAANRLMSGVYGPRVTPFIAAPQNAMLQLPQSDRRNLP